MSGVDAPKVTWTSSDETVAAVSQDGTVTAVARGHSHHHRRCGGDGAACLLHRPAASCRRISPFPAAGTAPPPGEREWRQLLPGARGGPGRPCSAFYTQLSGDDEFPSFMQQADQELMDIFYPGLSAVSSQQMLVYVNQMSMNMGELALIEVTDSKDVDGVKAILQARIDGMIRRRRLVSRAHPYLDRMLPGGVQRKLHFDGGP